MTTKTETLHAGGFLLSEAEDSYRSRDAGTLASGQNLGAGYVVSQVYTIGSATFVGTVGTRGTVTVAATVGEKTQIGVYKLICTAAASNAGTFQLRAPDGQLVTFDTATVITVAGGAFTSDHLGITIADGATDFSVGDTYTITITAGGFTQLAPSATDGSQIAAGILYGPVDASSAAQPCTVITRAAEVTDGEITWPSITAAQKTRAKKVLGAAGILFRT